MGKPADPQKAQTNVMALIEERLGGSAAEAMRRLQWGRERPEAIRNFRNWASGKNGPSFADLMDMLDEALLLSPELMAAWRDISLEEAERALDAALASGQAGSRRGKRMSKDGPAARSRDA